MKNKESVITKMLLILTVVLTVFFLNTYTIILSFIIIISIAIYDTYKKATGLKVFVYILVFFLFLIYVYFNLS